MSEKSLKELIAEMDRIEGNNKLDEIGLGPSSVFAAIANWIGQQLGDFPSDAEIAQRRGDGQRSVPSKLDSLQAAYQSLQREMSSLDGKQPRSHEEFMAHSQKTLELVQKSMELGNQIESEKDRLLGRDRDQENLARQQGNFLNDLERQINNQ